MNTFQQQVVDGVLALYRDGQIDSTQGAEALKMLDIPLPEVRYEVEAEVSYSIERSERVTVEVEVGFDDLGPDLDGEALAADLAVNKVHDYCYDHLLDVGCYDEVEINDVDVVEVIPED